MPTARGIARTDLLVAFGAFLVVAVLAGPILAVKPYAARMRAVYGLEKEKTGNCHLCHKYDKSKNEEAEGNNLGVFGKALKSAPEFKPLLGKDEDHKFTEAELAKFDAAVKALLDKDSDADGATNGEELALGTFPGDPASTPSKEALEKYRQEHPRK
ncbi:MAG: hypothetical protein NTW87_13540 [Planctomycetota bacterium]|nr:hypothetical protein [Planctomycetota bacterium]